MFSFLANFFEWLSDFKDETRCPMCSCKMKYHDYGTWICMDCGYEEEY